MRGPVEAGDRTDDPDRNSLRLLPSGPDRVGEGPVRRRAPAGTIPAVGIVRASFGARCGGTGHYASLARCERPISMPIPVSNAPVCAAMTPPGSSSASPIRRASSCRSGATRTSSSSSTVPSRTPAEEQLARGEIVFLGVVKERAHFALDLSPIEAPLEMLRSPALAASGIDEARVRFTDLRQLGGRIERREGALLALARAMMFW